MEEEIKKEDNLKASNNVAQQEHAGTKNLIPMNKRTEEEQKELAKIGGKASGAARRKKRTLREIAEAVVEGKPSQEVLSVLQKNFPDVDWVKEDIQSAMVRSQVLKALTGDTRAYEAVAATLGQSPDVKISGSIIAANIAGGEVKAEEVKALRAMLDADEEAEAAAFSPKEEVSIADADSGTAGEEEKSVQVEGEGDKPQS